MDETGDGSSVQTDMIIRALSIRGCSLLPRAVLVAIAIPIFTSQLEKARESTDVANIRDYYAEISASLLTGDLDKDSTTITLSGGKTATYATATGGYTVTVTITAADVKQTKDNWQSGAQEVAGCTIAENTNMVGATKIVYTFTEPSNNKGSAYLSSVGF